MDQAIFHLINERWTSPALDLFMAALSDSEIWRPLLIAIALSALFFGGFKARAFIVCLLSSLLIGELFTGILKSGVDRHRPKHVQSVRMVELQKARPKFMTLFKKPTIRHSDQSDREHAHGPAGPAQAAQPAQLEMGPDRPARGHAPTRRLVQPVRSTIDHSATAGQRDERPAAAVIAPIHRRRLEPDRPHVRLGLAWAGALALGALVGPWGLALVLIPAVALAAVEASRIHGLPAPYQLGAALAAAMTVAAG